MEWKCGRWGAVGWEMDGLLDEYGYDGGRERAMEVDW